MTLTTDENLVRRRILWFTLALAAAIAAGIALFFVFFGRVEPVLQSTLATVTTTL